MRRMLCSFISLPIDAVYHNDEFEAVTGYIREPSELVKEVETVDMSERYIKESMKYVTIAKCRRCSTLVFVPTPYYYISTEPGKEHRSSSITI